ncbi:MAG: transketolase [Planctomycetota bacterium]
MRSDVETAIRRKAAQLGKLVVRMTTKAGSGHPSSALSLAHIVTTLMYQVMRYDPSDPWSQSSDRLVLSEGHSVPIVYAAYADVGGIVGNTSATSRKLRVADLDTLRELDSVLDGHPNPPAGFPFFDAATGSLGQGLSIACGLALASRLSDIERRIYVIIGDGESREGQVWEAVDFAVDNQLTAVVPIFNANRQGQSDYVSEQQSAEKLAAKLEAYGMEARIVDGHDPAALIEAFERAGRNGGPFAVVAKTRKGWGVRALEDVTNHGRPLPEGKLSRALADLDEELKKAGEVGGEVKLAPSGPTQGLATMAMSQRMPVPDFEAMLADDAYLSKFRSTKMMSTRRAYGLALRELGKVNPAVVALDGDVSNSTFSEYFGREFPGRFFECRIAEQNMVSVAGGLAAGGKIPFASTFGKFLVRAYDQTEMNITSGHNMKLVGSHSGASLGADGPSQMGLVDLAFFRSFPTESPEGGDSRMVIFVPADGYAAYRAVELAARHVGPVYIRTFRPDVSLLYEPHTRFEIGGAQELAQGEDVTLVACGYMVHVAREAVGVLSEMGLRAGLVDVYSFPIRSALVHELAAGLDKRILTVEDNYGGGLGSAIAELAAEARGARVWRMTVGRIPKSGRTAEEVLEWLGLGAQRIAERARELARAS